MDVKQYYRKIHEVEAGLAETYPVLISVETSDGGKAGVISEVSRAIAAKMIVEGCAVLASAAEKEQHFERQAVAKKVAEKAELAKRVQVAIISDAELRAPVLAKKGDDPTGNGK